MNKLENTRDVDVCYKNVCVKAKGKNGEILTYGIFFLAVCIGINMLIKATK
jgi:hypothetical protein